MTTGVSVRTVPAKVMMTSIRGRRDEVVEFLEGLQAAYIADRWTLAQHVREFIAGFQAAQLPVMLKGLELLNKAAGSARPFLSPAFDEALQGARALDP